MLGKICHQCAALDQALNHFASSVTKLRDLNSERELATTLYDYGLALRDAQQLAHSRAVLSEAAQIFERLQLLPELGRTESTLDALDID